MDFKELKNQTFEEQKKRFEQQYRWDLGKHKATKLKVLERRAKSTLLCDNVSKKHAERLQKQFLSRWGKLKKDQWLDRLRFWTVLDCVVALDEDNIISVIPSFRERLETVCEMVPGIEVIGAFEIEVLNLSKMKQLAQEVDEARKLAVVFDLMPESEKSLSNGGTESFALIHFHGVVDLGMDAESKHQLLQDQSKWFWNEKYQVELGKLHSDKTIEKNLTNIARYVVKGGNENLAYKIGYGWDETEDLERKMTKAGKDKMGPDFDGFTNEMSLTMDEVRILGQVIDHLMGSSGSKNMRNGYLFRYGQQVKWI